MVASDLIDAFREGSKLISRREDDMYDRLSNRWSIGLLCLFALLITSYSYIGDPIDCYEPQEFEDQWVEYMDNVCWVMNTYYVPFNETIPKPGEPLKQELQYYQWVPIILVFQAFLFAIPGTIWNFANDGSGYNIKDVVEVCRSTDSLDPDTRDASVKYLINNMARFIDYRQPYKKIRMPMGKRYGRYIFIVYMFVKCLYIVNAIVQLFILSSVLGNGFSTFGWQAAAGLSQGRDWEPSPIFPRITLCSFEIRRMGKNIHRYTVQCLLSVNLFNEKIYVIVWWWLVFVASMSILGLLLWLLTATSFSSQKSYVSKYLKIMGRTYGGDDLDDFAGNYLRLDGVFTLRLIAKNTNDAIAGEVVAALYDKYLQKRKDKPLINGDEQEYLA